MTSTLMEAAPSSRRPGRGLLRTAGALVGGLGLAGVAAGGAALAWGSIERTMPVLRRYQVPVRARVPEVTILQIADLHLFAGQEFLLRFLSDEGVFIEYMYSFANGETANVIIRPNDMDNCIRVLTEKKVDLLAASDLYKL